MRRSQIHQSPKELVGTGSRSTDLEFVTHSNRTRCQFFTALIFYVSFVSRQKRQRTLYETRSPHHLLNSILYFKTNPPFSVETMFCHKYLRFRFTPPSPSRCFYSGELFILHPFRACRKTNRPSQFGRSVIRQSRRRERNTNTNQISCPYSPCFFNRLK